MSTESPRDCADQAGPPLLYCALIVSGASVMIIEILGTRVLGPFFGLGVQVWAALITVTLTALALGYWLGGAVADRRPSPVLFHAIILFAGIATALVRWVAGPVMDVFSGLGVEAGALFSALVIFGPALFFMGTPSSFLLHDSPYFGYKCPRKPFAGIHYFI